MNRIEQCFEIEHNNEIAERHLPNINLSIEKHLHQVEVWKMKIERGDYSSDRKGFERAQNCLIYCFALVEKSREMFRSLEALLC